MLMFRRAVVVGLIVSTLGIWLGCERHRSGASGSSPASGKATMLAQAESSQGGGGGPHMPLSQIEITVPAEAHTVEQVVNAVATQSGNWLELPRETGTAGRQQLDVTIVKMPFWQAVATISKGLGLGVEDRGGMGFCLTSNGRPIERYALVGPALLAVDWPVALERAEDGIEVPEPGLALRLYCDPWELRWAKIDKVQATIGQKKHVCAVNYVAAAEIPGYDEWVGLLKTKDGSQVSSISGEITCEMRKRFVRIPLALDRDKEADKDDVHVERTGYRARQDEHVYSFRITWKTGLAKEEAQRFRHNEDVILRGKAITPEERAWTNDALKRFRHLRVVRVESRDAEDDLITPFMSTVDDSGILEILVDVSSTDERVRNGTLWFVCADTSETTLPFEVRREEK